MTPINGVRPWPSTPRSSPATRTIAGRRDREEKEEDEERNDHRVERFSGRFSGRFTRRVSLPSGIDENAIEAMHDKGVLTIRLPETPEAAPRGRQIEVKAA